MEADWDLVVCGGGAAGLGTAAALDKAFAGALSILVLENAPPSASDSGRGRGRIMSLSWGSRLACESMGLWEPLEAHTTPIEAVQVAERGRFGAVLLRAREEQLPALGYTVWSRDLLGVLVEQLGAREGVTLRSPARVTGVQPRPQGVQLRVEEGDSSHTLKARLAVIAEGAHSPLRASLGILHRRGAETQHALLGEVLLEDDAPAGLAGERFFPGGHAALLPWGSGGGGRAGGNKNDGAGGNKKNGAGGPNNDDASGNKNHGAAGPNNNDAGGRNNDGAGGNNNDGSGAGAGGAGAGGDHGADAGKRLALVLVAAPSQVLEWSRQSPQSLAAILQEICGWSWGRFLEVRPGMHHPVQAVFAQEQVRPHVVLVGNAAHTLAPLAAQGYNLALRDAAVLAQVLAEDAQEGVALGALSSLEEYLRRRQRDQLRTQLLSRGLERVFHSSAPGVGTLRSLGMAALDVLPPLKSLLLRQAAGLEP